MERDDTNLHWPHPFTSEVLDASYALPMEAYVLVRTTEMKCERSPSSSYLSFSRLGWYVRMRDQAVAVQRVISRKVRRVNNDTDVRSVTLANTEGKKSPTAKVSATAPALDMVPNQ